MLTILLAALLAVSALAAVVSLSDSAIKWCNAYRAMKAEMALEIVASVPEVSGAVVTLHPGASTLRHVTRRSAPAPLAIAA